MEERIENLQRIIKNILASTDEQIQGDLRDSLRLRMSVSENLHGEVKGIQGMVDKDVCCRDVLTQISAIRAAINKVGVLLIENYARNCMGIGEEDKEELEGLEQLIKTLNSFVK